MSRPPIVAAPRNCWTVVSAEQAGVIVDASDYYVAFYKAALEARRYIVMAGWQFDSSVELLRGEDTKIATQAGAPTSLLKFLNHLCETRPELEIEILAWDFHVVLAFEREWMQKLLFHWKTHERLRFHFDASHPSGGCHHQKFVVLDGHTAFLGGIDLCEARWDDRRHLPKNPVRLSRGKPQKPYHDVQAYLKGEEAVRPLVDLFEERWKCTGSDSECPRSPVGTFDRARPRGALVLPPGQVAFSRTEPPDQPRGSARHIVELFADAIEAAERLIYIETQYFSSREIRDAIERRLEAADRPKLQLVVVVNARAEALKEQIAVGLRQAENLTRIRQVAAATGHEFGCYYTTVAAEGDEPAERTYVHSKLLIVDDHFLSVGSANLTNRSMGLDTELHATWDAAGHQSPDALVEAIRAVRASLLAEHAGLTDQEAAVLAETEDLIGRLDDLTRRPRARLHVHPLPTEDEAQALALVNPQELPFDPAGPTLTAEEMAEDHALFRASLSDVWHLLTDRKS